MNNLTEMDLLQKRLHWIFRISAALCFIGHGAFGIITKAGWLPYFAVTSIGPDAAYVLMPLVGFMDIGLGILLLILPLRSVMLWMAIWAVWTALLRPLAGQGIWEFFERAGNYGVPFAFLVMSGIGFKLKDWFTPIKEPRLDLKMRNTLEWILRLTTGLLLIGHGAFGAIMHKPMLVEHFQAAGLPPAGVDPFQFLAIVGWVEIGLGLLAIIKPIRWVLIFIVVWKMFTELLYPLAGTPVWEFIERFGSYSAPLALFFIRSLVPNKKE